MTTLLRLNRVQARVINLQNVPCLPPVAATTMVCVGNVWDGCFAGHGRLEGEFGTLGGQREFVAGWFHFGCFDRPSVWAAERQEAVLVFYCYERVKKRSSIASRNFDR